MRKLLFVFLISYGFVANAQADLAKTANDVSPLLIGEVVPNITIQNIDQKDISLNEITKAKKTILVFYRGGWCPYCTVHLSAIGEAEQKLIEMGYQIVAVSPDSPKSLKNTIDDKKLNYTLLSDSKGDLARALGIAFIAPKGYDKYLSKGSDGANTTYVPVPSVFILNEKSEILFEFINPSYNTRISNEMLLAVAKTLSK
ncbi:peroxiredoxin family protein [Flavobacterium sp.]|uniref:peroxiredoxin family protein n=1 Tax=Flavobacterium sp. TaxID=239 RepID=UPI00286E4C1E|nr:peroxiredoxin family protein [Flavobacterium sp.]